MQEVQEVRLFNIDRYTLELFPPGHDERYDHWTWILWIGDDFLDSGGGDSYEEVKEQGTQRALDRVRRRVERYS